MLITEAIFKDYSDWKFLKLFLYLGHGAALDWVGFLMVSGQDHWSLFFLTALEVINKRLLSLSSQNSMLGRTVGALISDCSSYVQVASVGQDTFRSGSSCMSSAPTLPCVHFHEGLWGPEVWSHSVNRPQLPWKPKGESSLPLLACEVPRNFWPPLVFFKWPS